MTSLADIVAPSLAGPCMTNASSPSASTATALLNLVRVLNQKGLFDVRYKAKPSVSVVNGRFEAQAAAEKP